MKKVLLGAVAAMAIFAAAPALAADIDINVGGVTAGVVQTGIANALSDLKSSASVDQIAGLVSVEGAWTDDVNAINIALGIAQNASAAAAVPPGSPMTATAEATIQQVVGLTSLDLDYVGNGANINAGTLAAGIAQNASAGAIGTAKATAGVSQLAGVTTIQVNVN